MGLLLFILLFSVPLISATKERVPDNVFSRGDLDYCNLALDVESASLYVGARGHIYRLWAYNINDTSGNLFAERRLSLSSSELSECRAAGNTDADCQPSTRFMALQDQKETLYVCSSVAMKPEIRVLSASTLTDRAEPRTEIGICSPDANVNSTAVVVEWGNPSELPAIYSGIRTGMAGENHLIYRPPLLDKGRERHADMRTVFTDSKWLNEPQFVGSFDIGEYVYFFFREIALESGSQERVQRSRVARVCKKDTGGRQVLRQVWTSFIKARLNCSISAQYPYYFDNIQSITKVETLDDTLFYAGMSTSDTAFLSSAVCVFSLKSINQLFQHSPLLEQTANSWLPMSPETQIPHRPGTCSSDSQSLSASDLNFAKSHLMIAEPIPGGLPIMPTRDVTFSHVLVDSKSEQNVVLAIDSRSREMWKISHWKEGAEWKWRVLEGRVMQSEGEIKSVVLLPGEFLFTATRQAVSQFPLAACALHSSCALCAIDPYCSWNSASQSCHTREKLHKKSIGWISSWAGALSSDCSAVTRPIEKKLLPAEGAVLRGERGAEWKRAGRSLIVSDDIIVSSTGDLVIVSASKSIEGDYEMLLNGISSLKYRVTVDEQSCAIPTTLESFKTCWLNHCQMKRRYELNEKHWTDQKEKAAQCHINESSNRVD